MYIIGIDCVVFWILFIDIVISIVYRGSDFLIVDGYRIMKILLKVNCDCSFNL